MARIQIVAFDNAVGNTKDVVLLEHALQRLGHEVTRHAITPADRRRRRGALRALWYRFKARRRAQRPLPFDLTIFLEHVYPTALGMAKRAVLIPNPEWMDRHDARWLDDLSELWSKTHQAEGLFKTLTPNVRYLGFTSEDGYDPSVIKESSFLHLAGKSRMKGTQALLDVWARHPSWPTLTVIHSGSISFQDHGAHNIQRVDRYLPEPELRRLLNAHRFHLCPSETEGWGHYIPEAMSMKNIVLTLDAAPMNEHVTSTRGVLFQCQPKGHQHLAPLFRLDDKALIQWMNQARYDLAITELDGMGSRAREYFLSTQTQFIQQLDERITETLASTVHDHVTSPNELHRDHHSKFRS